MGMVSALLVRHDYLHDLRDDKELGRKIYEAVLSHQRTRDGMVTVYVGDRHGSGIEVIGTCGHSDDPLIFVLEGNGGWQANKQKPKWSRITKWWAMLMLFGPQKPRKKK